MIGFKAVYVLDLSQTDGEPLPESRSVAGDPGPYTDALTRLSRLNKPDRVMGTYWAGYNQAFATGGIQAVQTLDIPPGRTRPNWLSTLAVDALL